MIEIKDLLAKYDKLLFFEENKRMAVSRAVSEALSVHVDPKKIRIKNGTVYIDLKPIYKNEILMKKNKILKALEKENNGKQFEDLR